MADQMSPEDLAAFEEWREGKKARKVKSTAKNSARKDLIAKYFKEYSDLVVKYGGARPKAKGA